MDFLNVDFAKSTTALLKEAFKFKKYKAMPIFFAIVVGICQLGIAVLSFIVAGLIYVLNFFKKLFMLPVEFIHGIVRSEKDEVKAGAQTVIYLISWPFIFLFYGLLAFLTLILNIFYIFLALTTFVWTLGGFRFHLLVSDAENIEKNVEGKYNNVVLIVFVVGIAAIAILLPIVLVVLHYIGLPEIDKTYLFKTAEAKILIENIITNLKAKAIAIVPVLDAFVFIYTLAAFIPFPKALKAAPAIAEVVIESANIAEESDGADIENADADNASVDIANADCTDADNANVDIANVDSTDADTDLWF